MDNFDPQVVLTFNLINGLTISASNNGINTAHCGKASSQATIIKGRCSVEVFLVSNEETTYAW